VSIPMRTAIVVGFLFSGPRSAGYLYACDMNQVPIRGVQ
jgi:hypothetical protein